MTGAVSNISFNLPMLKLLNQSFLVLSMNAGMDLVAMDPTNRDMISTIYVAEAMLGLDEYRIEYIGAYREGKFDPTKAE